jgi:hypothetical protein
VRDGRGRRLDFSRIKISFDIHLAARQSHCTSLLWGGLQRETSHQDHDQTEQIPLWGKAGQTEIALTEAVVFGFSPTRLHQGHFRLSWFPVLVSCDPECENQ